MNRSIYRFTLDIHKTKSQVSIPVMFGDTGIRFYISLTDGGKPYFIEDGCIALFVAKKSDGQPISQYCPIEENTRIVYDFTEQTTNKEGLVSCEIRLYGAEKQMLTTPMFSIVVDERVVYDTDVPESAFDSNILDAIGTEEAERIKAETDRASAESDRAEAEEVRVSAEGGRVGAENARAEAEGNRVEAEEGRVSAENDRILAEADRVSVENDRVKAEEGRVEAENARATAEESRVSAENARALAEEGRVQEQIALKGQVDTLATKINEEVGSYLSVSMNKATYVMNFSLLNKDGMPLDYASIDLPLESTVIGGEYADGKVILSLRSGEKVEIPISDIVNGLVNETDFNAVEKRVGDLESSSGGSVDPSELAKTMPYAKNYSSAEHGNISNARGLVAGSGNIGRGVEVLSEAGLEGLLSTVPVNNAQLESKSGLYNVISGAYLDKAVMEGLGNSKITWSDEYKASARNTIGATKLYRHYIFHPQSWMEGAKFDGTILNTSPTPITDDTSLRDALSNCACMQGSIDGATILQVVPNAAFVTISSAGTITQMYWWAISFAEGHTDTVTEV